MKTCEKLVASFLVVILEENESERKKWRGAIGIERLDPTISSGGAGKRELCHHYGDRPLVDSIYKVCQGHGLPTQDHGEPKRELCHHHGDRPLVDSI